MRTAEAKHAELLELLAVVSRSARSGAALSTCLDEAAGSVAGPVTAQLAATLARLQQVGLVSALIEWAGHEPELARAAWALAVAADTGGDTSRAVDAVVAGMRAQRAIHRELGALTAQAQLSAAVLACVPVGFGALLAATDARARDFLFGSPAGWVCIVLGTGLDALGWHWLRRIGRVTW